MDDREIRERMYRWAERDLDRLFYGVPVLAGLVTALIFAIGAVLHWWGWI